LKASFNAPSMGIPREMHFILTVTNDGQQNHH